MLEVVCPGRHGQARTQTGYRRTVLGQRPTLVLKLSSCSTAAFQPGHTSRAARALEYFALGTNSMRSISRAFRQRLLFFSFFTLLPVLYVHAKVEDGILQCAATLILQLLFSWKYRQ